MNKTRLVPLYRTRLGRAYVGDAAELLRTVPDGSVHAVITSPPFALTTRKRYGNPRQQDYVDWLLGFIPEVTRVLSPAGSLVLEIGGAWQRGTPTRATYPFELLVRLVEDFGLHLAQEFYWFNSARLPGPARWVTVDRIRVKDSVTPIWWLSKQPWPMADNRRVLAPYGPAMRRLLRGGDTSGVRPSGHRVGTGFSRDNRGAIPPNLIVAPHTQSRSPYLQHCRRLGLHPHPARSVPQVPEFFIRFLTRPGDLVLDPFAGSNTVGAVAERLGRRWTSFEMRADYLRGSVGHFLSPPRLRFR